MYYNLLNMWETYNSFKLNMWETYKTFKFHACFRLVSVTAFWKQAKYQLSSSYSGPSSVNPVIREQQQGYFHVAMMLSLKHNGWSDVSGRTSLFKTFVQNIIFQSTISCSYYVTLLKARVSE